MNDFFDELLDTGTNGIRLFGITFLVWALLLLFGFALYNFYKSKKENNE